MYCTCIVGVVSDKVCVVLPVMLWEEGRFGIRHILLDPLGMDPHQSSLEFKNSPEFS